MKNVFVNFYLKILIVRYKLFARYKLAVEKVPITFLFCGEKKTELWNIDSELEEKKNKIVRCKLWIARKKAWILVILCL